MKRAMARQAEAERERRAKVIAEVATEHNSTFVLPTPMDILGREGKLTVSIGAASAPKADLVPNGGGA
jgi:hypothetical protein